jgi:hypothetical protein
MVVVVAVREPPWWPIVHELPRALHEAPLQIIRREGSVLANGKSPRQVVFLP